MRDVQIRKATFEDGDAVAMLFSEFNALLGADGFDGPEAWSPENVNVTGKQMARRMRSMGGLEHVFLADTSGGPVGLCCLRLIPYIGQDEPYAEMTQLYVRPASQRLGVGTALLKAAEEYARSMTATCLHIITGQTNLDAQAFYRAQGYRSDDIVFDKYFSREGAHA